MRNLLFIFLITFGFSYSMDKPNNFEYKKYQQILHEQSIENWYTNEDALEGGDPSPCNTILIAIYNRMIDAGTSSAFAAQFVLELSEGGCVITPRP